MMKWRPETDISGARSEPVTASTGKGSKVIGRQAVGTRGKICLSQGWQCPPSGWEITYIESYKSISCLYSSNNIYIYCFFFFFMSFVIGHSPLGCDPSVLQAVIQLTTFLLYNEQLSMSEWMSEWVHTIYFNFMCTPTLSGLKGYMENKSLTVLYRPKQIDIWFFTNFNLIWVKLYVSGKKRF